MRIDKQRATKKMWRIPENTFMWLAVLGGSIGILLGMRAFRHKTLHQKFRIGVPLILIVQIALVAIYWYLK